MFFVAKKGTTIIANYSLPSETGTDVEKFEGVDWDGPVPQQNSITIFWFPSKIRHPTINTYRWISSITLFRSSSPTWPDPCGWIFTEAGESMNPNFKAFGDYLQGESLLGKVQLVTARSRFHNMENLIFRGTSKGFESKLSKHVFFFSFPTVFFLKWGLGGVGFFGKCLFQKEKGTSRTSPRTFRNSKFSSETERSFFCFAVLKRRNGR